MAVYTVVYIREHLCTMEVKYQFFVIPQVLLYFGIDMECVLLSDSLLFPNGKKNDAENDGIITLRV